MVSKKAARLKDVDIKLPEDFQDKDLAGKTASFKITLEDLAVLEIPSIDDDFAKDINYESKDKLVETITTSLNQQAENNRKRELEVKLPSALLENSFDVPPAMVDEVIDSMIKEMYPGDNKPAKEALQNPEIRASVKGRSKKTC